jgi:hypothetical protein
MISRPISLCSDADPGLPEVADAKERVAGLKQDESFPLN